MPNVFDVYGRTVDDDGEGFIESRCLVTVNDISVIHSLFSPDFQIVSIRMLNEPGDSVIVHLTN